MMRALTAILLFLAALLGAQAALAQDCPRPAATWTNTETEVWRKLCAGEKVDITPPYGRMELPADGKLPDNALSARFVQAILGELPWKNALKRVDITGAMVIGALDLSGLITDIEIRFTGTHLIDGLTLENLQASKTLACVRCYITTPVNTRRGSFGGDVDFSRTTIEGPLDVSSTTINGSLLLDGVQLGALVGRGLRLKGDLAMDGAKTVEINLPGASIGGDAKLRLETDGMRLLHLATTRVGGELVIEPRKPWPNDVRVNLSGVSAGALGIAGDWPANTDLKEVVADRLHPGTAGRLLERLAAERGTTAGAYRQLAEAATRGGDVATAVKAQRLAQEREIATATGMRRLWLITTSYGLIGYLGITLAAGLVLGGIGVVISRVFANA